jgi:hypothetical protein
MLTILRMKRQTARHALLAALFCAAPCLGLRWTRPTAAAQGGLTVVNAASFISSSVAPGSIAAIYGQFSPQGCEFRLRWSASHESHFCMSAGLERRQG